MEDKIVKEINDFKYEVTNNGMYVDVYLSKRKELIQRIDGFCDKCSNFFGYVLFIDMITHEQYLWIKEKIEKSRKSYKTMLSFY